MLKKNESMLAPYLYLFIMDLCRIPWETFEKYDSNEPGFAIPMLKAYIAAFQMKTDGKLSHELLKTVHSTAMSHLPKSDSQYRSDWGHFKISLYKRGEKRMISYSASENGIKQFIADWIDNPNGTHHLGVIDPILKLSYGIQAIKGQAYFCTAKTRVVYNEQEHLPIIINLLKQETSLCELTVLENVEQDQLRSLSHLKMQEIIDSYDREMLEAKEDNDKIRAICKHVQKIDQLHPFDDGNIRTCTIVLNKLLHDHNMPLSLLMNPNRLDCCTVDEIVTMVQDGQKIYKSFIEHSDLKPFTVQSENEIVPSLRSFTCKGVDLKAPSITEQFLQYVLNAKKTQLSVNSLLSAVLSQFKPRANLLDALRQEKYSLALRIACTENNPALVRMILRYKNQEIEINQQSSNGNTALDWFDLKTKDSKEKNELRSMLVGYGAKNNKVVSELNKDLEGTAQAVSMTAG